MDNNGEDTFVVGHLELINRYGEASIRSSSFGCDRRRWAINHHRELTFHICDTHIYTHEL